MASLSAACRTSARLISSRALSRSFTTSPRCLAAQNFTMPALSPTMTEGNIAGWKVKEGDSFSAGDVLLEIETDKANMDVEAQEDGIMVKIMQQEGSKSVQVGSRIAVVAEAGDDISTLEIPADESPKQADEKNSASKESKPKASGSNSQPQESAAKAAAAPTDGAGKHEHKYPLLPSVGHLVKQHGLSEADVSSIKGTGPGGRLLKGDILAYLGSIDAERPAAISSRFEKLSHLDLSNIKVAEKKPAKSADAADRPGAPVIDKLEIQVPVSLAKVVSVQKKIEQTLGVFLPLSTFIARAAEVANDNLPRTGPATANDLFDQILGLDKIKGLTGSRGVYLPQISAIPPPSVLAARSPKPRKTDIFDELAPKRKQPKATQQGIPTIPGLSNDANVFSLTVTPAEEERAQVFLERCKIILEDEPGRLVL